MLPAKPLGLLLLLRCVAIAGSPLRSVGVADGLNVHKSLTKRM
jgi:hypothetical protein